MASSGLLETVLAAVQASLSVLLVIFYGVLTAKFHLLDSATGKKISKLCVRVFLPALLLTKIGSELHVGSAQRYGIILIWAFLCHFVSFLIGISAHLFLKFPDWITVAIMFNNTTSYPLLLIQSLDETGILKYLVVSDETTSDAIERAKSYFLVFATVSSCLTFAVGPRLVDTEHGPDPAESKDVDEEGDGDEEPLLDPSEETELLRHRRGRLDSVASVTFFPSQPKEEPVLDRRRPRVISKERWVRLSPRTRWWLLFFFDFLNAPLLGAVLGAVIGLTPPLHRVFFSDTDEGGWFSAWLTVSMKNIGMIFVPLPLLVAGVSLYTSWVDSRGSGSSASKTPWLSASFVLAVRFIIWPAVSISVVFALAKKTNILGDDPILWFAMMLMPTGPPAMKLITMAQVSDAGEEEEHKIASILTISYIVSPILAFTVVGALHASHAAV